MKENRLVTVKEDHNNCKKVVCKMGDDRREDALCSQHEKPKVDTEHRQWNKCKRIEVIRTKDNARKNHLPPAPHASLEVLLNKTSEQKLFANCRNEGDNEEHIEQLWYRMRCS